MDGWNLWFIHTVKFRCSEIFFSNLSLLAVFCRFVTRCLLPVLYWLSTAIEVLSLFYMAIKMEVPLLRLDLGVLHFWGDVWLCGLELHPCEWKTSGSNLLVPWPRPLTPITSGAGWPCHLNSLSTKAFDVKKQFSDQCQNGLLELDSDPQPGERLPRGPFYYWQNKTGDMWCSFLLQ